MGEAYGNTLIDAIPEAARKACNSFRIRQQTVNFVMVTTSSTFETNPNNELRRVIPGVKRAMGMLQVLDKDTVIIGSTTGEIAGIEAVEGEQKVKEKVKLTITVAHFPNQIPLVTHIKDRESFSLDWRQDQWINKLQLGDNTGALKQDEKIIFVLYHPEFVAETRDLMSGLDFALPNVRKFGFAAGIINPLHEPSLSMDSASGCGGALVLVMDTRDIGMEIAVAQGVRGLGPVLEVIGVGNDEGNKNEITSVKEVGTGTEATAGPMTLLDMWIKTDQVPLEDGRRASKYLLLGTEVQPISTIKFSIGAPKVDEQKEKELVMLSRKILAFNERTKSIQVDGDAIRLGTKIQLQIRDEESASIELNRLLDRLSLEASARAADGFSLTAAILLLDTERGSHLHGALQPNLDVSLFSERFPGVPTTIISSPGQIGPLPSGGILSDELGHSFMLSASALYITIYSRTGPAIDEDGVTGV